MKLDVVLDVLKKYCSILGVIIAILCGVVVFNNMQQVDSMIFRTLQLPKSMNGVRIAYVGNLEIDGVYSKVKRENPNIIIVSAPLSSKSMSRTEGIERIEKLSTIAVTFYVDDNDEPLSDFANVKVITDKKLEIFLQEKDTEEFIQDVVDADIVDAAKSGDEVAIEYLEYVGSAYENTKGASITIVGISGDGEFDRNVLYNILGNVNRDYTIVVASSDTDISSIMDVNCDIVFTTYNKAGGYKSGYTFMNGTALFSVDAYGKSGLLSANKIQVITLNDTDLKDRNPLERLLGKIFKNTEDKFDVNGGYEIGTQTYVGGREQ